MKDILDIDNMDISIMIEKMNQVVKSYEKGEIAKKDASKAAKKLLAKFEKFVPNTEEKEKYDFVHDLGVSLSTIDRSEPKFESFYLKSLKEELEKAKSL